jgi:hypothetical protein
MPAPPPEHTYPAPLASPWRRFLSYLLTVALGFAVGLLGALLDLSPRGRVGLLSAVTAAYLVWDLIAWRNGQTPVYQLLEMQVVEEATGLPASWWRMFVRGFVGGIVQAVLSSFLIGLVLYLMPFWDRRRQLLWDKISGTVVLDMRGRPLLTRGPR